MAESEKPPASSQEEDALQNPGTSSSTSSKKEVIPSTGSGGGDAEGNDFFAKITQNDVTAVTNDLKLGVAKVDSQDEHGMTPLMHAAYRGNKEMCELLLDHVINQLTPKLYFKCP